MSKNKTVSIITVCYNAENEIEETIQSIIPFINQDVEYIIIDGNSDDKTLDIINNYVNYISVLISEEDSGIYDAMNKGIRLASGNWIIFINIGDKLLNIPKIVFNSESNEFDAIACAIISENGQTTYPSLNKSIKYHNTLPHQSLFYNIQKKNVIFELTYNIYSDYDYNLYMYKNKYKILLVNRIVAFHSLKGISNNKMHSRELYSIIEKYNGKKYVYFSKIYFYWCGLKNKLKKWIKIILKY